MAIRWAVRLVNFSLAAAAAFAQGSASVHGRVTDPHARPVAGARLRIENPATGLARETLSGDDGRYAFPNLPFQNYRLHAAAPGFAPESRSLDLHAAVPVAADFPLRLEASAESVTVAPDSDVLLDPATTGTRTELNIRAIEKLPVAPGARGLESVLLTMPGFAANANGAIHPRGAHNQMTFVVDGMPVSDQLTGAFANAVDPAVVESLDLYTGNVPAEFGNKVSAVAVVTTRTGIGSGRRFQGSTRLGGDQFDTLASVTQVSGGSSRAGYFASFTAMKSNRFLDAVSRDNLHNGGNSQRAFLRGDLHPGGRDMLRASVMAGRSSFQLANLRSQHANGQDQRQRLEDLSAVLGWTRTLDARTTVEAQASFRNAFAALTPSAGDTPVTASQARRLTTWNFGARGNRAAGSHTIRAGADFQRFPVREHFTFAITAPAFNDPAGESHNPSLAAFDLTRGGRHFAFARRAAGSLASAFVQDQWKLGRWQLALGLRWDRYAFLVRGSQWQPRLGLSYHLRETGTVLRASYNRNYQTPPNENLLMASSPESAVLAPPEVREALGGAVRFIRPERQDVWETGLQQSLGRAGVASAAFYHKTSRDLQDNDNFFNTGIIFPTSLARARVNGAEGRVQLFPGRRFAATVAATHYRAVVTPPFTGGLFLGAAAIEALTAGPFVIDHDQKLSLAANAVFHFTRQWWTSTAVRYDSGLVSNPSDPAAVRRDPDYADLLPLVNLASDPARVRPRTVIDWVAGYTRTRSDGQRAWEIVATVNNLTGAAALYNFQSIFVGTRVVAPRSAGVRLRVFF
jgi:hypothetical protein